MEDGGNLRWNILTGSLTREEKRHNTLHGGKVAGCAGDKGYTLVTLKGVQYMAHIIVFFLHEGKWPTEMIDHINGNRGDNRPENLREATASENSCNSKTSSRNSSGVKGVSWNTRKGKWKVRVTKAGKCHFGGWFDCLEDATAKANSMRESLHGDFSSS